MDSRATPGSKKEQHSEAPLGSKREQYSEAPFGSKSNQHSPWEQQLMSPLHLENTLSISMPVLGIPPSELG